MSARACVLAALIAVAAAAPASAQRQQPRITPGAYAGTVSCPNSRAQPIDIYFLNDIFPDETWGPLQRARVEVGGATYVASIFYNGMGRVRVYERVRERAPPNGWDRNLNVIDFDGAPEQMSGSASIHGQQECRLRPRRTPTAQSLEAMSYPTNAEIPQINHAEHRGTVPADFPTFTPPNANAMSAALARAVADDSESWMMNEFTPNSVDDFHFYHRPGDTNTVFVWAAYRYTSAGGFDSDGWVLSRFRSGSLDCIQYHDRRDCMRPRQSRAAQVAALGQGRQHLGAMPVPPANCFSTRTRTETRSREVVVGREPGRTGDVITRTEYYSVPVQETIYTCASVSYELECIASGVNRVTEYLIGQGATRRQAPALTNGQPTGLTPSDFTSYNARIQNGTCVRTR